MSQVIQYSSIISPEDYNRMVGHEHLYIKESDNFIFEILKQNVEKGLSEVVEIGCGPGRLTQLISKIENINLTAVDTDSEFIKYAKSLLPNTCIVNQSVLTYRHSAPVDAFISQGMHHHIGKGEDTKTYLRNIAKNLRPGGIYIISDEFIPDYNNEAEREINLVIWYSHIIASALKMGYSGLAKEEAKTLLDDIYEGREDISLSKTQEQIELVLLVVESINKKAIKGLLEEAKKEALQCITALGRIKNDAYKEENSSIKMSRGDYKISNEKFADELENTGLYILSSQVFGPIERIGAMVVHVLKKIEGSLEYNN